MNSLLPAGPAMPEKRLTGPVDEVPQDWPMSFGQQRMWLLQQTLPDPAIYNQPVVYRLRGAVKVECLQESLRILVQRHVVLRTALVQQGGQLWQRISGPGELALPWETVDWRTVPVAQQEALLEERLAAEARRPFDLSRAPLWRVLWLRLGADDHVLLMNFHHSLIDVWSLRVLFQEWSQLYAARGRAVAAGLVELPMQYAQYAVRQREQLTGERLVREQSYWRQQLQSLPPPLELPVLGVRPLERSGKGAVDCFQLPESLAASLLGLAQQEDVTPYRLMLAAFKVWLHRYTGQSDIIVGTPVANRQQPGVQSLVGFFLNTLPIRTQMSADLSFRQLIRRVQDKVAEALAHAELPFEQIVEMTAQGREGSQTPLYQVMFVMTKNLAPLWSLGQVKAEAIPLHTGTSKSDLVFTIHTGKPDWAVEIEYASDIFTAESIGRMAGHFKELLHSIVADPDEKVGRLNLLPAAERHQLLVEWNDTPTSYPPDQCVHQLFEAQAERSPEAVAVVFEDQSLTYRELNARANQLAHLLRTQGVTAETPVALCMERSLALIVGLLAILKAGGAYVPIDPGYPADRMAFILEDARAPVLLSQRSLEEKVRGGGAKVLWMDDPPLDFEVQPSSNPAPLTRADSNIYIIYTSGSTGKPKGCCVTHHNVTRLFQATQPWFDFNGKDVWTLFHSYAFDFSVWEIWGALLYGGKLVIVPHLVSRSPQLFCDLLLSEGVTVLNQTPSAFKQLIAVQLASRLPQKPALRYVIFGGEALDIRSLKPWFEAYGDETPQLVNMYGITETTVHVTYRPLTKTDVQGGSVIGIPIPDLHLYVLDAEMNPCPVGVAGEMYVGGAGVARGYLHRPELTAERFLNSPFVPGEKLYRTGDLARWLPDRDLEYLGRKDQQVKVRGFRIELGEVEAVLGTHPEVESCAVVAKDGGPAGQSLSAFVVPGMGTRLSAEELRRWLLLQLPDYMVPAHFAVLESLPLTPHGKLDRAALLKVEGAALVSDTTYVPPRTELEGQLAGVWQEILQLERVGVTDDFFALGGHSLLAIMLGSRLSALLQRQVPLRWIFEYPTLEALARQIGAEGPASAAWEAIPLADREQPLLMSFGQQRMWLLQQTLPDPATYNVPVVYHLQGPVQVEHLRSRLEILMGRHEVLRTALVQEGEALLQKIIPATEIVLPWIEVDLQVLPAAGQREEMERQLAAEVQRPFDLGQAPLWRACWLSLAAGHQVLALTFHHAVMDEWSLRLLFKEWEQLCAGRELPALPVQYADYANWQRQHLSGETVEAERAFWAGELSLLPPPLELPTGMARPVRSSGRGAGHRFVLPDSLVKTLRELARQEGTSLFSLMLGAYQVLLHRYTGQDDLIVGTPVANRSRPEVQSLLGFFLNTLPLRSRLECGESFRTLLGQTRERVQGALSHAGLPFEQMVVLAAPGRERSQSPLYQAMFVLVEEGLPEWQLGQVRLQPQPVRTTTSKCDLTLSLNTAGPEWTGEIEYASDIFTAESIGRMAGHFKELLHSIVADPDEKVGRLNLLPAAERHQLLVEWNDTPTSYPPDQCVHQLFEAQAERSPEAVAVVFEDQSLTYRELNARANQLAHHLRSLEVGSDVPVGLCLERSLEMVIALLGILKAGGAYVPLDPHYPKDRLALIIQDSAAKLLITQSRHVGPWPESPIPILCLDSGWEKVIPPAVGALITRSVPESPAYIIFTSGSTGRPKGVAVEHRQVIAYLQWAAEIYCIGEGSGAPVQSPLAFDLTVTSLLLPLVSGKTALLISEEESIASLADALRQNRDFSLVKLTPSHLEALDILLGDADVSQSTRNFVVGGEPFSAALAKRWQRRVPRARFFNEYGPTETTVGCCIHQVLPDDEDGAGSVPIGKPVPGTQLYVLDPGMQPVPIGVLGELFIGGEQLARGYWKRPDLTRGKFVSNLFDSDPRARLYRTGDRCRWLPDGRLDFLGRLDDQVKVRGFRIELGEIEAVLGAHPGVTACAVVAVADGAAGSTLNAFVVAREREQLAVEDLRGWLQRTLPDYMVPTHFALLELLPLTPNGKLDRTALLKLEGVALFSGTEYVAPRTELESRLVALWQEVLKRERVGIHDDFFALGGHSLLAIALGSRLSSLLQRQVPLRWIFEHPTPEALARRIGSEGPAGAAWEAMPLTDREQPLPMSFGQQRMWLLQQTLPDPAAYNMPMAYHLQGPVSLEGLRKGLEIMLERHEGLRTALIQQGDQLVQQVMAVEGVSLPWSVVDFPMDAPGGRTMLPEERLLEEVRRPFDLAMAPLWRVVCLKLGEDEHILLALFHHSIADEWSLQRFVHEWERLYAADGQAGLAGLPELPVQYADYAAWQRQRLTGELLEQQQSYWREQLQDLPPALELPADRARPARSSGCGALHDFVLSGPVLSGLRELARLEGVTLFTVLLAVFQVWLYRYTGQADLVVGTPVANRERPEIQSLIGFFLNTLPIRVRLEGSSGFRQVLQQVRESLMGALNHAELPFEQMVGMAVRERDPGHTPLYQVMFILLEEAVPSLEFGAAKARPLSVETGTCKNDLTLSIETTGEAWACRFEYATDLLDAETAARMASHLTRLFHSITADPEQPVNLLPLMPEKERHQILVEWNRTARLYPKQQCLPWLIEEQAALTPDTTAVVFEDQSLTYLELNTRANALAHHLISLGVGPEVLVGICVERSPGMVIGLLAILKAGGAYVPLDPAFPQERLAFMIGDAAMPVLLTERGVAGRIGTHAARVVWLEDFAGKADSGNPPHRSTPASLAYVIYTSGSTGQPKGVEIPHQALLNCLCHFQIQLELGPQDVLLAVTTLSFDIAGLEIWLPLLAGARLVIATRETAMDGRLLNEALIGHGATVLQATPATWQVLLHSGWQGNDKLRILCGGEAVPQELADRLAGLGSRAWNVYGPTETTIWSTTSPLVAGCPVNIGGPLANTQVYVLDASCQPLPIGVPGDLLIGGDSLARGYRNQPELTSSRFVADPFSANPDTKLYRTGDRAKWLADGRLEFLGRADFQVKIRGFRIELGDIESALLTCPALREVVVIVREDTPGDKQLVAYLVARAEETSRPDAAMLRAGLAAQLPDYMLPNSFVWLDQLPLTPNGKVDRRSLPPPVAKSGGGIIGAGQPVNRLEFELLGLWQQLFKRQDIGREDNFFELGGHSLQAVRLAAEIDRLLGCKLPIAALFQSPTIASLARRLSDEQWTPPWSSLVPLQPSGTRPPFYLVHGWGGDVYTFLGLARLLPPDQPVYGIQAVGLDGKAARHTTVEEMAAHYVQEILSHQPEGPYFLGGYSMGGLIAFEIARQLHCLGHRTDFVALLDTVPVGAIPWTIYARTMGTYLGGRCLFHLRRCRGMPMLQRLSYLHRLWRAFRLHLTRNRVPVPDIAGIPPEVGQLPQVPGFDDYYFALATAYRIQRYAGSVDVFVSDETKSHRVSCWQLLAQGGAAFHLVPGAHHEILSADYLPVLAVLLDNVLRRAQDKAAGSPSQWGNPEISTT